MTTTLDDSVARFTADPSSGRTRPEVTAVLANGHARLSAGPFNWEADLPPAVGGANQAPSPTAYLLGALAGCAVAFINDSLAPEFDVAIEAIEATANCGADLGGLLGVPGTSPELSDIGLDVRIVSSSSPSSLSALQDAWRDRCPIYLALMNASSVRLSFS